MTSHPFFRVFLALVLCVPGLSQTVCNSTLTGTFSNIIVRGSPCTLDGVNVQILSVVDGGSLTTLGQSQIFLLLARNAGDINLLGTTSVLGSISFMNSGNMRIGRMVSANELVMGESGTLRHEGSLRRLMSSRSGKVIIDGGKVDGGVLPLFISRGNSSVWLCGATIGEAQVSNMPTKIISSNSPSCPPSEIRSLLLVEPEGSVIVKGLNILETFSTTEGFELRVDKMLVSSTKINGAVNVHSVGNILFTSVTANETMSIANVKSAKIVGSYVRGNITIGAERRFALVPIQESLFSEIIGSTFRGDVSFGPLSGRVTIIGSKFSDKTVAIETRGGAVRMTGNDNLNMKIHENSVQVKVKNNRIGDGLVSNNEAAVTLAGNTFQTLSCSGNDPPPVLVSNFVANGGSGQCEVA